MKATKTTALFGRLDDLSSEITPRDEDTFANPEKDSHEYNKLDKKDIDRYGPGNLNNFIDFNEYDGGDGQMGVAGDGSKGSLEEIGDDSTETVIKSSNAQTNKIFGGTKPKGTSRDRSARNAWGTSSGYGDTLREKGVDTARAQQLENWQNQLEVLKVRKKARYETDEFDRVDESTKEEDWRTLKKFGVERNQDFDLDEAFGPVTPGEVEAEPISLTTRVGGVGYHSFTLCNQFMGFADFRASLTTSDPEWTVEPGEGSINKSDGTEFTVRWRPSGPGADECFLVIETEDFKKTWRVTGNTA